MKRSNVIGILAAAAVIVLSVVLISWYLTKRTPTLIQGTVECTTYKASSKVPGRIDDMKVAQGDRVEKGQLLYTLSTPELEAKLRQAEAVKSAAAALDAMALAGARVQQIEAAMNMWQKAQATTQPVIYQSHNLFNPYLGYGTFVMPAIIMVIIQQTMLIGIGMIGGTWREFGLYRKLCPAGRRRMSTLPIVLGRGLVYALIYAVTCTYILGLHYRLFHFPMNGATGAVMLFMAAYLAACIAMGIAVSTLFRYRENSLLLLLWTSIPVLMLSGVSYPRQGIPDWLFNLGQLFPSSHGVNGFIRIQTMGASIPEVCAEIKWLIILTVVYGGLACIGIHQVIGREQREHPARKENGDEGR